MFSKYASVILDLAIDKTFDYGIKPEDEKKIKLGMHVEVPIRNQKRKGYVLNIKDSCEVNKGVKPISQLLSKEEIISTDLLELATWMAQYYSTPIGKVIKTMLPISIRGNKKHKEQLYVKRNRTIEELVDLCSKLRVKKVPRAKILDIMIKVKSGILLSELLEKAGTSRSPLNSLVEEKVLIVEKVRVDRSPLLEQEFFKTKPKILNDEQQTTLNKIVKSLIKKQFQTHLIHGVTGSGKTEVYLQAIEQALELGFGAIMLVPEISLTEQTIERFRSRFDSKIAILHHRLSCGEKFDEWHKIKRGEAQIVIGARSAVFSPVKNLGLIVVDEEHERSYKQSESLPTYHARDVAVMRSKICDATVILGSATPSIESYYNTKKDKYVLSYMSSRANSVMPDVKIVDMRREYEKNKGYTTFSDVLLSGIKKRYEIGEQVILFLNRRGYHTMQVCPSCGCITKCPNCDLSLTFHRNDNALSCHLCDYIDSSPGKICANCNNQDVLRYKGIGTEHVERALRAIFPEIRTCRMDADTTKHKGSHEKLLRFFRSGKADVLIGTQMIGKGLHFPQVTLVGILNSDSSLHIPDFRSAEYTFQLITQVAGRAGRGHSVGEVIVQTKIPDHKAIKLATTQDYYQFYQDEIAVRKFFDYPPFVRMIKIVFSGLNEKQTNAFANAFRIEIVKYLPNNFLTSPVIVSGYSKVKNKYRFQFLIRGSNIYAINKAIELVKKKLPKCNKITNFVDIDPISTFH